MSKRPNILKLATKISLECMTYTGLGYKDPEYRILDPIVDDDMCAIMMHLRLEENRTAEDVAKKARRDLAFTQEQLTKLQRAGIVRTRIREGVTYYFYPIWVPGIMEGILSVREQCEKYPNLAVCFEEYTRLRVPMLAPFMDTGMNLMRVIPVQSAIENDTRRASYDEVLSLVEKAYAVSVGPCSCRRSRRLMGEGCGHLEDDMCMYLNDNAINYSQNGDHRLIDKEEAYEILKRAEANGLVHELNVVPGYEDTTAICNCCGCSCFALRIASYFQAPDAIRSNYIAKVDRDKCVACGQCVENCQVNAVRLGQKLCDQKTAIPRPAETPRNTLLWGKDRYTPDYRKTRTDVTASGTAPCKTACPAHIAVQGYLKLASQGRYQDALELIKKENPFPAVCGRICNKPCEQACLRASVDEAVAIDEVKRFIADRELKEENRYIPPLLNQIGREYPEKIAVIGAGPAGLSCAYYLREKGYPVTVFEKEEKPGGMLTLGIPNFRLEKDVLEAEIDVLCKMGVEFRCGVEIGKDITIQQLREEGFKGFYLAIGAQKSSPLGIPGEELEGVWGGIDFLRQVNLGKLPEIGTRCAVIGGGNVAMDVCRTAIRLGAKDTYVLYRRGRDEMPADPEEVAEAEAEGVQLLFLTAPAEILGQDGKVCGVRAEVMKLGEPDEKGRRKPVGTGEFRTVEVDAVIAAIGQQVDWGSLDVGALEKNSNGTVKADGMTYQTAQKDIFTGGDVLTGPKFAIDAIAAGKQAAISLHRFVHEGQTLDLGRDHRDYRELDRKEARIDIGGFDRAHRQVPGYNKAREKSFTDARMDFTEEQVKKECARCLSCGTAVVDEYMCVGCGICTVHCRFDAIHLEKIHDADNQPYFKTLGRIVANIPKKTGNIAVKHFGKIGKQEP